MNTQTGMPKEYEEFALNVDNELVKVALVYCNHCNQYVPKVPDCPKCGVPRRHIDTTDDWTTGFVVNKYECDCEKPEDKYAKKTLKFGVEQKSATIVPGSVEDVTQSLRKVLC